MKTIIQALSRIALVLCILAMFIAANLSILPSVIAFGYIVALTATLMLTYV